MKLLLSDEIQLLFPTLSLVVTSNCLVHGTIRADVWRYLVLWLYGGIYADIDAVPNKVTFHEILNRMIDDQPPMEQEHEKIIGFNTSDSRTAQLLSPSNSNRTIAATDGIFVVEQYHLLSQWFMIVKPKHPLMYYAAQYSIHNVLLHGHDTGTISAAMYTGPHALHNAYRSFRRDDDHRAATNSGGSSDNNNNNNNVVLDARPGNQPVRAGYYTGTNNYSITVLGKASQQNEYVTRDVLGGTKKKNYKLMNMTHFQDDKKFPSNISCLKSILDKYSNNTLF
jgi:Glycosyltransferase sugar-binding region containing DXD motif